MEFIIIAAIIVLLVMIYRWLGPPVRHLPNEPEKPKKKPIDIPPPWIG